MWDSKMLKLFIFAIIVLCFILALLFLPRAKIVIKMASEPFMIELEIKLDAKIEKVLTSFDAIPAKVSEFCHSCKNSADIQPPAGFVSNKDLMDVQAGVMLSFRLEDLEQLVISKVQEMVAGEEKQFQDEKILFDWQVESLDLQKREANLDIRVEQVVFHKLNLGELRHNLVGKTKEEAVQFLAAQKGVRQVTIRFWPHFLKRLPPVEKKIDISLVVE